MFGFCRAAFAFTASKETGDEIFTSQGRWEDAGDALREAQKFQADVFAKHNFVPVIAVIPVWELATHK